MEDDKKPNLDSGKSKSGLRINNRNKLHFQMAKGRNKGSVLCFSKDLIVLHTYRRCLGPLDDLFAKLLVHRKFHHTNKIHLDNR